MTKSFKQVATVCPKTLFKSTWIHLEQYCAEKAKNVATKTLFPERTSQDHIKISPVNNNFRLMVIFCN